MGNQPRGGGRGRVGGGGSQGLDKVSIRFSACYIHILFGVWQNRKQNRIRHFKGNQILPCSGHNKKETFAPALVENIEWTTISK